MSNLFLNSNEFSTPSFETQIIKNINFNSIDLETLDKHKYLGKRAEFFMKAYLDQYYHPIYHSLQIHNNKLTLGELDFLFYDQQENKWIHLELICKFYVFTGNEDQSSLESWIGPNLKDRLDYKVEKLKTYQLQICSNPKTKVLLKNLNIDLEEIETKLCYKAKLYIPQEHKKSIYNQINPNCIEGKFFNFEEFKKFKFSEMLYYIPPKHEWLCQPKTNKHWYDFEKAIRILKPSILEKRSQLVWRKTKTGEFLEDFVVWW